jgi:hypothetical protein
MCQELKYLGMTVTNQNMFQEEIKRRLNSGNTSCHSVQKLLSSHLLSKNVKIRIYKTIILPVVLYGCETCSLPLSEEHGLKVRFTGVPDFVHCPGLKTRTQHFGNWICLHPQVKV